jgi:hypothetical protein
MLVRARKLRKEIGEFVEGEQNVEDLNQEEWTHVDYLLYPFYIYTNAIGATANGPTIQEVFRIYNKLFTHLEKQIKKLQYKRLRWKVTLRQALENGHAKLKEYYSKTKGDLGSIYGIATIFAPGYKLSMFETEEWQDDEGNDWVRFMIITLISTMLINKVRDLPNETSRLISTLHRTAQF